MRSLQKRKALKEHRKAVEVYPKSKSAHARLCGSLLAGGKLAAAQLAHDEWLKVDPLSGSAHASRFRLLLRIEEQKPQLPPPPPPKGGEAMSTMRLLASGYSAKAVTVSTMSAHMCDYGEDL